MIATAPVNGSATQAEPQKLTKASAIRAAIKAGKQSNRDIIDYVKAEFGLEATANDINNTKRNDSAKSGKAPAQRGRPASVPAQARPTTVDATLEHEVTMLCIKYGLRAVTSAVQLAEAAARRILS